MTRDVVTAEPDTTFKELARLMDGYGNSGLPVVAGDGHPIGVVTRTDLLVKEGHPELEPTGPLFKLPSHRAQRRKASDQVAAELMTAPPVTVGAGTRLARAARRMADAEVKRLLVVDDEGRLIGIVSRVVSLQGRIERRSLIPSLIRVIRGIDGVVAVDARLSWDADDTVKPPGPSEVIA